MKKLPRPLITIGIGLLLALFSTALPAADGPFSAAALFMQATAPPVQKDLSEIGSTDGIVIMGFVIALIIITPILLRRKAWMEPR